MIAGPADMICSEERIAGYRAALDRYAIPFANEYLEYGDFYTSGGREGAAALLDLAERPTAIFALARRAAEFVGELDRRFFSELQPTALTLIETVRSQKLSDGVGAECCRPHRRE